MSQRLLQKTHGWSRRLLTALAMCLFATPAFAAIDVVTTTTDLAFFAERIGGNRVNVEALARPQEDIHAVQVKPSFLAKLNKADCFVMIGLDLEGWVPPLLKKTSSSAIRPGGAGYVVASTGVFLQEIPTTKVDRSMGDIHAAGNPHCWLSAVNAKIMARNVRDGLIRVDPAGTATYKANYEELAASMERTASAARALIQEMPSKSVVQQHSAFVYLFSMLGIETAGTIEPRPGIAPGAEHLTNLRALIDQQHIRVVATEGSLNQKTAKSIASSTGATLVVLGQHVGSLPGTDSWEALIMENARRLAAGLKGATS